MAEGWRLDTKIKATWREVCKLSELQKGMGKMPRKYNKVSIPEAPGTAQQRLIGLATRLKRYTEEAEARRINKMFSTKPSKVYFRWQGHKTRTDPPWTETEQYWKLVFIYSFIHSVIYLFTCLLGIWAPAPPTPSACPCTKVLCFQSDA